VQAPNYVELAAFDHDRTSGPEAQRCHRQAPGADVMHPLAPDLLFQPLHQKPFRRHALQDSRGRPRLQLWSVVPVVPGLNPLSMLKQKQVVLPLVTCASHRVGDNRGDSEFLIVPANRVHAVQDQPGRSAAVGYCSRTVIVN